MNIKYFKFIVLSLFFAIPLNLNSEPACCAWQDLASGCNYIVVSDATQTYGVQLVDCGDGYYSAEQVGLYGSCPYFEQSTTQCEELSNMYF